jgi:WD40 repeat protein
MVRKRIMIWGSVACIFCLAAYAVDRHSTKVEILSGHTHSVHSISFSADGQSVISGGGDGFRVWNRHRRKQVFQTTEWPSANLPASAAFVSAGEAIYSDSSRGVVVLDTDQWDVIRTLGAPAFSVVTSCSRSGDWIVAYFTRYGRREDGLLETRDLSQSEFLAWNRNEDFTRYSIDLQDTKELVGLSVHPLLPHVAGVDKSGQIRSWDLISGKRVLSIESPNKIAVCLHETSLPATVCVFSPDGSFLYTPVGSIAYPNGDVTLFDMPSDTFGHHRTVAVTDDGSILATGGQTRNRTGDVILWRTRDLSLVKRFSTKTDFYIKALRFSPDGKVLATGGEPIRGWERGLVKTIKRAMGHPVRAVCLWPIDADTM